MEHERPAGDATAAGHAGPGVSDQNDPEGTGERTPLKPDALQSRSGRPPRQLRLPGVGEDASSGERPRPRGRTVLSHLRQYWARATTAERQAFLEWTRRPEHQLAPVDDGVVHEAMTASLSTTAAPLTEGRRSPDNDGVAPA